MRAIFFTFPPKKSRMAKHRPYFIGADIGTSSSKALGFSDTGKLLCQHQVVYPTSHPAPAFSEQDPDQIVSALFRAIHAVVRAMEGRQPEAVCLSSAMHSLMAINGKGETISPLIIWSDGRSEKEAQWLKAQNEAADIYQHTGTPIHPMSPLCKLLWMKKKDKALFKKATRFISIKDYVLAKFFDEYLIDYSLASATGLFDHKTLKWYDPALEIAGIKADRLAEPVSPLTVLKGFKRSFSRQTGLDRDVPIVIGAGDGCLANLGTGVTGKGELAATIGTSGAVRLYSDKPVLDPKQRLFNYLLLEKEYISGGAINNGGVLLDWFGGHFMEEGGKEGRYDRFLKEAFSARPGSRGLLFLPYLQGERSPMWDARARGAFLGISYLHERKHFMRAVVEGICFSLFDSAHILEKATTIKNIYVSGGFTRSPEWVQLLTDLFAREVKVAGHGDASSTGAALMGMRAVKAIHSWKEAEKFVPVIRSFKPGKGNTAIYRRNFDLFSGMYETLAPMMHAVAGWQGQE